MNARRRFRRSSPDAPQGVVPVLVVFVGLLVVVAATGIGFLGRDGASTARDDDGGVAASDVTGPGGSTTAVPGTLLIRGSTTTTLFVTTTTPITTTTSTTTTTLPGPVLDPDGPEVTFAPGELSVSFTVRSSDPDGVEFTVTSLPPGIAASPTKATVSSSSPVTVTLRITDPDRAEGGTMVLVGDDGSRVPVNIVFASEAFSVAAVSFDPDPPVCGTPGRLVALVTGTAVTGVSATVSTAGGGSTLSLSRFSSGAWAVGLPNAPTGSTISGTVVATDAEGRTAARNFSSVVTGAPGCRR